MVIKIELSNAFSKLNWHYIYHYFISFGLYEEWSYWVYSFYYSTFFFYLGQ